MADGSQQLAVRGMAIGMGMAIEMGMAVEMGMGMRMVGMGMRMESKAQARPSCWRHGGGYWGQRKGLGHGPLGPGPLGPSILILPPRTPRQVIICPHPYLFVQDPQKR